MREYKFRGKDIKTGEWVYGNLVMLKGDYFIFPEWGYTCLDKYDQFTKNKEESAMLEIYDWNEVDPKTIGQYIGKKDKNGKEVYEGDILMVYNRDRKASLVKWDEYLGYVIQLKYTYESLMWLENFVVIGNIHDNPELLEVKNED